MRKKIISTIIAIFVAFFTWALPKYFEVNNMITAQNSYWLLYAIYIGTFIVVCVLIWGYWSALKRIRFQSPIKIQPKDTLSEKESPSASLTIRKDANTTNVGIADMVSGARSHKCSLCGYGFRVPMFNYLATCPKCGNVDDMR